MKTIQIFLLLCCSAAPMALLAQPPNMPDGNIAQPPPLSASDYPGLENYGSVPLRNFIRTYVPSSPTGNAGDVSMTNQSVSQIPCFTNTQYFDGLGRPLQDVFRSGSQSGAAHDLVTAHAYDAIGNEAVKYLPYPNMDNPFLPSHGKLNADAKNRLISYYGSLYPGQHPYSKTEYDQSPLNRPTKAMAPGANWVGGGKGITYSYLTNVASGDQVANLSVAAAPGSLPVINGYFGSNELYAVMTTDEDGNESVEYKDKRGRVVCKRARITSQFPGTYYPFDWAETYYLYDDLDRLRWVLSPEAVAKFIADTWAVSQGILDDLCYRYEYDKRGRQIAKKLPGKAPEYFVYDTQDRMVLSQDGNLQAAGQWAFTSYDGLGRTLSTGIYTAPSGSTQASLAVQMAAPGLSFGQGSVLYYIYNTNLFNAYPVALSDGEVHIYRYYDDYSHAPAGQGFDGRYNNLLTGPARHAVLPVMTGHLRGLATGTRVKVMDPSNNNSWVTSTYYYDNKGQLIQQQADNILGGVDVTTSQYDFAGTVISNVLHHTNPNCTDTRYRRTDIVNDYSKNQFNGIIYALRQNINSTGFRVVYGNNYSPINQLIDHSLGGNVANTIYTYNIRNWLTGINPAGVDDPAYSRFFSEQICYDQGFNDHLSNGNISGILWRGAGLGKPRFYGYNYDGLGRLKYAEFGEKPASSTGPSMSVWSKTDNDFTVSNITYDRNGNLKSMDQRGPGYPSAPATNVGPVDMDKLVYAYAPFSNKLLSVTDNGTPNTLAPDFKDLSVSGNDYDYDANGNLTVDNNKEIRNPIAYSYLNKPTHIEIQGKGTIDYLYDAIGNKLRKTVGNTAAGTSVVTDYDGPCTYETQNGQCALLHVAHSDGRCRPDPAVTGSTPAYKYDYYIKDHLDNVRTVITTTASGLGPIFYYNTSLEIAQANTDGMIWGNLDKVREDKPGGTEGDTKAAMLDGSDPEKRIGTAIMLRVMPGDKFSLKAESYFDKPDEGEPASGETLAAALISTLTGGTLYNGVPVSEMPDNVKVIENAFGNDVFVASYNELMQRSYSPERPRAFLNYVLFDENYKVMEGSGVLQTGANGTEWHVDEVDGFIEVKEPGYLAVWTANKGTGTVFYDKLDLTLYKGEVTEENQYYPFGLTLSAPSVNPAEVNHYKYNTKELESSFGLETYDYGARMYNPQIGRWNSVDPYAAKYVHETPYNYAGNNPVRNIDIGGKYKMDAKQAAEYKTLSNYLQSNVQSDILGSKTIMAGLSKYSGGNLTPSEVRTATTWKSGPTIKITKDPGINANGRYDYSSNTIYINAKLAKQLEDASPEDKQAALYGFFVTLTHETVHYGDYLDGKRQESSDPSGFGNEPGTAFMNDVFYTETVESGGEKHRVLNPALDHTKLDDAKNMIERHKKEGDSDVIPTVPETKRKEKSVN